MKKLLLQFISLAHALSIVSSLDSKFTICICVVLWYISNLITITLIDDKPAKQ